MEYIKDFVSISASISAFLAALAAMLTVREIKRQREMSIQPDISLNAESAFQVNYCASDVAIPLAWNDLDGISEPPSTDAKQIFPRSMRMPFYNVGLNTAKNLHIRFSYDIRDAVKLIEELNKKHSLGISLKLNEDSFCISAGNRREYMYGRSGIQMHSFLMGEAPNNQASMYLPIEYTACLEMLAYLYSKESGYDSPRFDLHSEAPELTVEFTYSDISSKMYTTQYLLTPHLTKLAFEPDSNVGFEGSFTARKLGVIYSKDGWK